LKIRPTKWLIASYHGMIYGTSRQAFALGRAGYLPGAQSWLEFFKVVL
jgi:hypothetical protein